MLEAITWFDEHATMVFLATAVALIAAASLVRKNERQLIREHAEELEAHNALIPSGPGLRMVPQLQQVVIRPTPGRALRLTHQTVGYRYFIDGKEVSYEQAISHGLIPYNPRKD